MQIGVVDLMETLLAITAFIAAVIILPIFCALPLIAWEAHRDKKEGA